MPLFATGVATFTGTNGTGTFVRTDSPVFTGDARAVTPATTDNDTSIATTAFVKASAAPFDALAYNGMQINGGMDISQETAFGTGVTANGYVCDGWVHFHAGTMATTATLTPSSGISGLPNLLFVTVQTAQATMTGSNEVSINQWIEGYRVTRLGWGAAGAQPITIGFWSGHARTGTYTGTVRNGPSPNRSYAFSYTQSVANANEYKTITIPGDTAGTWDRTNAAALCVNFAMAAGPTVTAPSLNTWLAGSYAAGLGQINGVAATLECIPHHRRHRPPRHSSPYCRAKPEHHSPLRRRTGDLPEVLRHI